MNIKLLLMCASFMLHKLSFLEFAKKFSHEININDNRTRSSHMVINYWNRTRVTVKFNIVT